MRFLKIVIISTFFFALTVWYSQEPALAQEASTVRATQVDSAVAKNGAALKEGETIQRGDQIASKEESAAVLTWSNGSMVKLYPNTSIVMRGVSYERDRKMEKTFLTLEKGRLFVKAQVPEHMFEHFEIIVRAVKIKAQASEFAVKYDPDNDEIDVWSLLGTTIVGLETEVVRIEEGQQVKILSGSNPDKPVAIADKTQSAMLKISKKLGGSLLIEDDAGSVGGPLKVKIGGVKNRRGNAPYTVMFKAIVNGGSGKIKSINWNYGDGKSEKGKTVKHTFTQGVYGVSLTVEDENGDKASGQINISVEEDCDC